MKYSCYIDINLPLDKTVELWEDETHFNKWQDGFQSIKLLSGTKNTNGAKSKIFFGGKRKLELLETIVSSNLPQEKIGLYEHIHMTNTQTTRFEALDHSRTRYTSEVEYTQFNGFLIKIIAKLFPGKFKGQSEKWMQQFKAFAENHG